MPLLHPEFLATRQCVRAFDRIGWAFILAMFAIPVPVFVRRELVWLNVDIVAYAIWLYSSWTIRRVHSSAKWLTLVSASLVATSLLKQDLFVFIGVDWLHQLKYLAVATHVVYGFAHLLFVVMLCGMAIDIARYVRLPNLEQRARFRRNLFVASSIAFAFVGVVARLDVETGPVGCLAALTFAVFSLVAYLLVCGLSGRVANACVLAPRQRSQQPPTPQPGNTSQDASQP